MLNEISVKRYVSFTSVLKYFVRQNLIQMLFHNFVKQYLEVTEQIFILYLEDQKRKKNLNEKFERAKGP